MAARTDLAHRDPRNACPTAERLLDLDGILALAMPLSFQLPDSNSRTHHGVDVWHPSVYTTWVASCIPCVSI